MCAGREVPIERGATLSKQRKAQQRAQLSGTTLSHNVEGSRREVPKSSGTEVYIPLARKILSRANQRFNLSVGRFARKFRAALHIIVKFDTFQ